MIFYKLFRKEHFCTMINFWYVVLEKEEEDFPFQKKDISSKDKSCVRHIHSLFFNPRSLYANLKGQKYSVPSSFLALLTPSPCTRFARILVTPLDKCTLKANDPLPT